ncbi:MAG TPA: polysaccharide pyruvyl transferase family protein [Fibrobacteraceae bacterium]|nr:polysaccharide pyruvyl transferase family protein [Fibrobacteraceae bacterium]
MSARICIVGWYGTETIGDRAILTGLFKVIHQAYGDYEVRLGSLFPFFSRRTLEEDAPLWESLGIGPEHLILFPSKDMRSLDQNIAGADLVCMGGGPLMDLQELLIIAYAFQKARSCGIKTAILGCGIGPLYEPHFRRRVAQIARYSDLILLRDTNSLETLQVLQNEYPDLLPTPPKAFATLDPAVICSTAFQQKIAGRPRDNSICINLRTFPSEYLQGASSTVVQQINAFLQKVVSKLCELYPDRDLHLVAMHYFTIGNDDRRFLSQIKMQLPKNLHVEVAYRPLSLAETMEKFYASSFCVGMRFHAVLLQTLLNGNNSVIDYTPAGQGKINSFLKDIDSNGYYRQRTIGLLGGTDESGLSQFFQIPEKPFVVDPSQLTACEALYLQQIRTTLMGATCA